MNEEFKDKEEIINTIVLTRINFFTLQSILYLYREQKSATAIMEHKNNIREIYPNATEHLADALKNSDSLRQRAEEEVDYCLQHGITPLCMNDPRYPQRLKECVDAPLVLYYKGNADLNQRHVISLIGTRQCTIYGADAIRKFICDLHQVCPQVLIVSGLAYGVDINAHRNALTYGYDTVGVLAHGLDTLYPTAHRDTANQMIQHGGLITEFTSRTKVDKVNFVRRNRIIAGMSDACILVESGAKGGGLITTEIARSYNRDVYAFPGRITDEMSKGCNNLIRRNAAGLITCAKDFVSEMGWEDESLLAKVKQEGIERNLFPDLSPDEQKVVDTLKKNNNLQINILSVQANIEIGKLSAILFNLEMKGVLRTMAGGVYHLF